MAFAIPIAVVDLAMIPGDLEVRYAAGNEIYLAFSGEVETSEAGEVIFADQAGKAHARRWINRQSAQSAVRGETINGLIVAEVLHEFAAAGVQNLINALASALGTVWGTTSTSAVMSQSAP